MKNKYKISELAKIFNISRQTLLFYHKKDILIPNIIDKNNGYRYYTAEQVWDLLLILTLKKAGFSLEEIKKFGNLKNYNENILFLEKKVKEVEERIKELKQSKKELIKRIETLKEFSMDFENKIEIKEKENMKWIYYNLKNPKDEIEMLNIYEKLYKIMKKYGLEESHYITMVDLKEIEKENNTAPVSRIGIEIPKEVEMKEVEVLKINKVLEIKFNSTYNNLLKTYKDIKKYIKAKNYQDLNYSIELSKDIAFSTEEGVGGLIKILIPIL